MRDITVTGNLIRRIHDDHALAKIVRKDTCRLAQDGRLAHTRSAEDQDAPSTLHEVTNDVDRTHHCPPGAACQADDISPTVADR